MQTRSRKNRWSSKPSTVVKNGLANEQSIKSAFKKNLKQCKVKVERLSKEKVQALCRTNNLHFDETTFENTCGQPRNDQKRLKPFEVKYRTGTVRCFLPKTIQTNDNVENSVEKKVLSSKSIERRLRKPSELLDVYDFSTEADENESEEMMDVIKKMVKEGKATVVKRKSKSVKEKPSGPASSTSLFRKITSSLLRRTVVDNEAKKSNITFNEEIKNKSFPFMEKENSILDLEKQIEKDNQTSAMQPDDHMTMDYDASFDSLPPSNDSQMLRSMKNDHREEVKEGKAKESTKNVQIIEVFNLPNIAKINLLNKKFNSSANDNRGERSMIKKNLQNEEILDITSVNYRDFLKMIEGDLKETSKEDTENEARYYREYPLTSTMLMDDKIETSCCEEYDTNDTSWRECPSTSSYEGRNRGPQENSNTTPSNQANKSKLSQSRQDTSSMETYLERESSSVIENTNSTASSFLWDEMDTHFNQKLDRKTYSRTIKDNKKTNYFILFDEDNKKKLNKVPFTTMTKQDQRGKISEDESKKGARKTKKKKNQEKKDENKENQQVRRSTRILHRKNESRSCK